MESETPTIVRSDAQFPDTRKAAAAIRFGTILPAWAWSCLFCASLLVLLLRLWRADLHVPLLYGGDALLFLSMAKGMIEGHWIWFNPHLGLPFGFDLRDLPIFITLDGAVMKGLTFLSHSPGRIVNLTWLLGTVLASGSMTWCLKRFSINSGVAICGGVIYALQPYGFYCGIQHLHSMFYLVPFIATGAIELVSGRMLRNKTGALPLTGALRLRELVRSVPAYLWLACIGIGISYVYTAFFSCFLLFIGGLLALAIRRRFHEFAVALLMVVLICGVQLVNLSPALYYQAVNGKNFAMDFKTPAEEEAYGLEIQHLLTPIPHNPFPALRHVEETMAKSGFEQPVENTYAKLGLIGSAGFVFLVAFILVVPITRSGGLERNDHLLGASAALMLPCLLLGTIGGFGAFFNVFVMPDIRCYNRIVPFIEYFCVAAVALILVRVEGWWFRRRWPKNLFAVILASITIFAGTDQAMVFDYVQYGPRQETFYRDGAFVKKIEATLPDGGAVFELPYTPFPLDTATVGKVGYYEQAKPYLHSKKLGWSWGVMQGRAGDEWVRRVVALSVPNMLHELVHAGFSGLWLDQFGYINGDSPQGQISQVLETAAMRDSTGRFLFYDLRPFAAKVTREESKMSPAELLALHPVEIIPDGGLYGLEANQTRRWYWAAKRSGLVLHNELNITRSVEVRATLETQGPGEITIRHEGSSDKIATSGVYNYKGAILLPAGGYVRLDVACDCKRVDGRADSRLRYLNLVNLRAVDPSLSNSDTVRVSQIPVVNGGFESAAVAPWLSYQSVQAAISREHVHSGRFSLQEFAGIGSLYQDVNGLQPGTSYVISAWVASSPGTTALPQIAVFDPGTNIALWSQPLTPSPNWQLVTREFIAGSRGTVRIHLFRQAGTGALYWDDVQVSRAQ